MCRELSVQFKGDLRFSSDWLRAWRDFSRPITGQRKAKIYKKKTQIFFSTRTRELLWNARHSVVISEENQPHRGGLFWDRSDEGLTLETSAFKLFTVANLRFQLSC